MIMLTIRGLLYPFLGTLTGSSFVLFAKNKPTVRFMAVLDSLAAGIMCAASFFSLILPALEQSENDGNISKLFCSIGFFSGIILFITVNKAFEKLFYGRDKSGNMLVWAVSFHNIPEGMAVGVVYASILAGSDGVSTSSALALSLGIAMQNIPEGAIISLPMKARGKSKFVSFLYGTVSGIAELLAGALTLYAASFVYDILPFSLCFAAGAMFYVVLAELSSNFSDNENSELSLFTFGAGFIIMMLLDTYLG